MDDRTQRRGGEDMSNVIRLLEELRDMKPVPCEDDCQDCHDEDTGLTPLPWMTAAVHVVLGGIVGLVLAWGVVLLVWQ